MDEGTPPPPRPGPGRIAIDLAAGALLGAVAFLGPAALGLAGRDRGSLLQTAAEGVGVPALAGLFVVGILLGFVGVLKPVVHGLSTMAAMPVLMFADMVRDPSSHNLLPFELGFYALYGMLAAAGAWIARALLSRSR